MADNWKPDYKGYGIMTHSSGAPTPPFFGHFAVTSPSGDDVEITYEAQCPGSFATDLAAQDAADVAARAYIDSLPARES